MTSLQNTNRKPCKLLFIELASHALIRINGGRAMARIVLTLSAQPAAP
jgi:hypothetical protein